MATLIVPARRTNVSSVDRLKVLPTIFRGSDITVRFQWNSKTASHYLWLWKRRGLVEPLGGHSDVFANLMVDASPNWEAALLMARPSAVIVGIECLRRAGWTTQIPARPEVAIDHALPLLSSDHFSIERRSEGWFETVRRGISRPASKAADAVARTAPELRPAWALADMLATSGWGPCGLQPDDIDFDVPMERDRLDWVRATRALRLSGVAVPQLMPATGGADERLQAQRRSTM